MSETNPKIAYLTSGAANMFCGSCLHDNTLARALTAMGAETTLIPTYTPIRTDEEDVSVDQVFFGGVNVYLQQKFFLFRYIPRFIDRFLDVPWLIRKVSSKGMEIKPKQLGALTVSMLRGKNGHQRKEVKRLCGWLRKSLKPDVVVLSNLLIGGCAPSIRTDLNIPVFATLQGDDIFLDDLVEPYRSQALSEMRSLVKSIDGFLVNSDYYGNLMSEMLEIPKEKIHVVPLGIDTTDFETIERSGEQRDSRRVGYLARLSKEKGLHVLVDAFIQLKKRTSFEDVHLDIAGWRGSTNIEFANEQLQKLRDAGLESCFTDHGTISREQKLEMLSGIDLMCVPTVYREPKGLFVLESLAAGFPVVVPDHGAFPELLGEVGGGEFVPPNDADALCDTLAALLDSHERLAELGSQGRANVIARRNMQAMASRTLEVVSITPSVG